MERDEEREREREAEMERETEREMEREVISLVKDKRIIPMLKSMCY